MALSQTKELWLWLEYSLTWTDTGRRWSIGPLLPLLRFPLLEQRRAISPCCISGPPVKNGPPSLAEHQCSGQAAAVPANHDPFNHLHGTPYDLPHLTCYSPWGSASFQLANLWSWLFFLIPRIHSIQDQDSPLFKVPSRCLYFSYFLIIQPS